jgi:hypothetical protein
LLTRTSSVMRAAPIFRLSSASASIIRAPTPCRREAGCTPNVVMCDSSAISQTPAKPTTRSPVRATT